MEKKGYKVVKVNDKGEMVSSSVGTGIHKYGIGMVTEPRFAHGPLTVFTDPYKAIGFIGDMKDSNKDRARLFKCEYDECTKVALPFRINEEGLPEVTENDMPKGTDLARRVKLLEEMPLPSRD